MQHHLSHDVEWLWRIADLVVANGTLDLKRDDETGTDQVTWYAGVKLYIKAGLPMRVRAAGLDETLRTIAKPQPFASAIQGDAYRHAAQLVASTYTLDYARGDFSMLRQWADHVQESAVHMRQKAA